MSEATPNRAVDTDSREKAEKEQNADNEDKVIEGAGVEARVSGLMENLEGEKLRLLRPAVCRGCSSGGEFLTSTKLDFGHFEGARTSW